MKKTILTVFAFVSFASASFAQMGAFNQSFTLIYNSANAANCLSNNVPNNGGIATNGGAFTNASSSTYGSLAGITLTTNTTATNTTGNAFNMFEIPLTVGSGPSAVCSSYRAESTSGITFASQSVAKVRLYIHASVAGTPVRFWLGQSGGNYYPTTSTYNTGSNNNSFIKDITLGTAAGSYVDIDYTGDDAAQWTAWAGKNDIDMWGLSYTGATDGITVTVEKILFGAALLTATENANVVNDQVAIAPNPASTEFNVDMTAMQNTEAASVKVLNSNGVIVKEFTTTLDNARITTEGLIKGIYMVRITSGNKVATKKVVVE